jgi:hypothetical protein
MVRKNPMKKTVTFIALMFLLYGCSIVGSESYFAASSMEGKAEWGGDTSVSHITGKPDAIRYSVDDLEFNVYSAHFSYKTYSFGPCIPIPLPIIPVFGLDYTEYNDPLEIRIHVFQSAKQYKLVKAVIFLANRQIISPKEVKTVRSQSKADKEISKDSSLPLSLNDRSTYVLTYDALKLSTPAYELDFLIQNESGSEFFRDQILFKQDTSTTFTCTP